MIFNIIYITLSILIIALIIFYRSELNHNYHKLYDKRDKTFKQLIINNKNIAQINPSKIKYGIKRPYHN